jgi:hypothetical protein
MHSRIDLQERRVSDHKTPYLTFDVRDLIKMLLDDHEQVLVSSPEQPLALSCTGLSGRLR